MSHSLSEHHTKQADARVAEARRLYEQGALPVRRISELCGLTMASIYSAAKREGWAMRAGASVRRRRKPGGMVATVGAAMELPARRRALIARAWALAEARMAELERRMRRIATSAPSAQSERDARAMASLVRALKELAALDGLGGPETLDGADQNDNDAGADFPRDVDQLKEVLTRHLEGLRRERAGKAAAGNASE